MEHQIQRHKVRRDLTQIHPINQTSTKLILPKLSLSPTLPKLRMGLHSLPNSPKSICGSKLMALHFTLLEPLPPIKIKSKHRDKFSESPIRNKSPSCDKSDIDLINILDEL